MKKHVCLLPILGMLLSGCSFSDIISFVKKDNSTENNQTSDNNSSNQDQSGNQDTNPQDGGDDTPTVVHVQSVSFDNPSASFEEGTSGILNYTVYPSNATNKDVEWSTSNAVVACIIDGVVYANNPGTATITISSIDGGKTATCNLTVTKKEITVETVEISYTFDDYYSTEISLNNDPITFGNITMTFSIGEGAYEPKVYRGTTTKKYEARLYKGNTITITNSTARFRSIEFVFSTVDDGTNEITSDCGTYSDNKWTGESNTVVFTVGDPVGSKRRLSTIILKYEGSEPTNELVNLGVKTISEVKQYIEDNPFTTNSFGNGVNEYRLVTIEAFAMARIDLVKTKKSYGLDVSKPGKVIMADSTGCIGAATEVGSEGTTLWGKVGDYACKETSKYIVTGYISLYLGHPEICVTSFSRDENLPLTWNPSALAEETATLSGFYERANEVNYNCAGHGYGKVLKLENLKCYYSESDGQHKRYYNFTDGTKNIRVNAFNLSTVSVGSRYDIVGVISIKNLSPIIIAFSITPSTSETEVNLDYESESVSQLISIANLKKIKVSQDDTDERYPDVINAYGTFYKTTGYLTAVKEGEKYYVGISDSYIDRDHIITGKYNAMNNYGVALIKNNNFWDVDLDELYLFNPVFEEYVLENKEITVYYTVRQLEYQEGKPMWEILLVQDYLDSLVTTE